MEEKVVRRDWHVAPQGDEALNAAAVEFFIRYARMEYALKAADFLVRENGRAEANWPKLASEIHDRFSALAASDEDLGEACTFLRHAPPKKQIVENGILRWSDSPPNAATDTELLLRYVSRVRNNLFHGGKFNGRWLAPERSADLLPRCALIMDACLTVSDNLREAYLS
ncbi:hypothetical protein [Phenylobacterium sp.]|uniref:hypothetical protein n=1 Tax=Phenylobacterium sp. TaxID=1871053 RepID=UPI002FE3B96C